MLVTKVAAYLNLFAPRELSDEWDNVGLIVGAHNWRCRKVMTCLTLTPDVAEEAIRQDVDLIVTHHPVLFRAVKQLTSETIEGEMLLELIHKQIAVYSPHTAFDSTREGINQQLAESLGLTEIQPLRPSECPDLTAEVGGGRYGVLPKPMLLEQFVEHVKQALGVTRTQYVGSSGDKIERVAVACGAAAEFLKEARPLDCDVLVTGEARFHACLEARASCIALVLPGHYATERPAVEALAERLAAEFPNIECFASRDETDPLEWSVDA